MPIKSKIVAMAFKEEKVAGGGSRREIGVGGFAVGARARRYIDQVLRSNRLSYGPFHRRFEAAFADEHDSRQAVFCNSGTSALHLAVQALKEKHLWKDGDEVLVPAVTFIATSNVVLHNRLKPVFVDVDPLTYNIDPAKIEAKLTRRTRAVMPVHLLGLPADMDPIRAIAARRGLKIVEDSAETMFARYKGRKVGSLGDVGCFSFHETKNLTCGEGGALTLNRARFVERAEVLREKGTNRSKFFRGEVDKYTWIDLGSNFLMSELNAAFLAAQLEAAERVSAARLKVWSSYAKALEPLAKKGSIELARVPAECRPNGHLFYLKTRDAAERARLIRFLKEKGILSVFHYVPLHRSKAGRKFGRFSGRDRFTTRESERLLRLPLWYGMDAVEDVGAVARNIAAFYGAPKRRAARVELEAAR